MRWEAIQVQPTIVTMEGRNTWYLAQLQGRPQQKCDQTGAHTTDLRFTASTREPAMCAMTFSAKELEYGWVQGLLDVFADWVGEEYYL